MTSKRNSKRVLAFMLSVVMLLSFPIYSLAQIYELTETDFYELFAETDLIWGDGIGPTPPPIPVPHHYDEIENLISYDTIEITAPEFRIIYDHERIRLFDIPVWDMLWLLHRPNSYDLRMEMEFILDAMRSRGRSLPPAYEGNTIGTLGCPDGSIRIYSMATGEFVYSIDPHVDTQTLLVEALLSMLRMPQVIRVPLEDEDNDYVRDDILRILEDTFNLVGIFNYYDFIDRIGIDGYDEETMHVPFPFRFRPGAQIEHYFLLQDNRTQVMPTTRGPYYAVVHLNVNYIDARGTSQSFVVTGFLISHNVVMTAGHNVFSRSFNGFNNPDNFARSVSVSPGFHSGQRPANPYGTRFQQIRPGINTWVGNSVLYETGFTQDYAFILLDTPLVVPSIFHLTARNYHISSGVAVTMVGYPFDRNNFMMRSPGSIQSVNSTDINISNLGLEGNSGGPIYDSWGWVLGVVSRAHSNPTGTGLTPVTGARIGQYLIDWLRGMDFIW